MPFARWRPYRVSSADDRDRPAIRLDEPLTGEHDQDLTFLVAVPVRPGARREADSVDHYPVGRRHRQVSEDVTGELGAGFPGRTCLLAGRNYYQDGSKLS